MIKERIQATMSGDDIEDIKVGLDSLRKAIASIRTARIAVKSTLESHGKRDAEIALTHAEDLAAVAERLFSSAVKNGPREAEKVAVDPYADCRAEDLP